jgi:CheY-like chemotaxis protein
MTNFPGFGAGMSRRPKAILCLCHDSNMLLIRRMLLEHFGYTVLPTTSVEDARNLAEENCPDMLLMDNGDPEIDFRKLAEQVKRICPDVITVVLSPYYRLSGQDSTQAVDRFVAKDDGPDELIAQIQDLLGERNDQSVSAD